jgi:hypothetical protein
MPFLSRNERASLLGPNGGPCSVCASVLVRQYCRTCDEFFFECPECLKGLDLIHGTASSTDKREPIAHVGHRTYRWIDGEIVARPDFDAMIEQGHDEWNRLEEKIRPGELLKRRITE